MTDVGLFHLLRDTRHRNQSINMRIRDLREKARDFGTEAGSVILGGMSLTVALASDLLPSRVDAAGVAIL